MVILILLAGCIFFFAGYKFGSLKALKRTPVKRPRKLLEKVKSFKEERLKPIYRSDADLWKKEQKPH